MRAQKVKTSEENISQYENHNLLFKMEKPKSIYSVSFYEDPKDDFMINAVEYKKKTGEITHDSLIIQPDIENFVRNFERSGFEKI